MTTVLPPYPPAVADLLPMARELVNDGKLPARNLLMRTFRIGAPKATELREQLAAEYVADMLATDTDEPAESDADPWAYAEPAGPNLPTPAPTSESVRVLAPALAPEPSPQVTPAGHPDTATGPEPVADEPAPAKRPASWPVLLLALPAFVAVWSGWVGLGRLTGFGMVDLLPGIVAPGSWAT
ncbi:MAG TPA: ABC transporter permease, partial [Micromonospora sp.]|nr:ABC transporter permease [Micromonospora sp.]